MKRLCVLIVLLIPTLALAQESYRLGPIEIINEGAPTDDEPASEPQAAGSWADALSPAMKLGIVMAAVGVPMGIVVIGRIWRGQPEYERALILLSVAMGRGRGFRHRVRSLSGAHGPGRRPISPIAMLLAPRAFDTALDTATHAERAYGVPLRHAVHGFRKN
ncbi:MAG: hypothetical protein RIE77_01190 [Phycisphaerales bacterium]|jgi:hypothetical protein